MSASHHDREEETLIAYFQQMLADVDDQEFDGELQAQGGDLKAAPADQSVYSAKSNQQVLSSANEAIKKSAPAKYEYEESFTKSPAVELEPQRQLAPQTKVESSLSYANPSDSDSLQRLLATVGMHAETDPVKVELAPQIKVDIPKVEVAPVETKVASAPEVKVEVAPVEAKVASAPEVKVEVAPVETKVASVPEVKVAAAPVAAIAKVNLAPVKAEVKTPQQLAQERMAKKLEAIAAEWKNVDLGEQFQVLFFLVQGVRFAVPLIDLGGIFECEKITQLFGKPSWFMGITDVRGTKINIVDTLRWVMPEINDSPDKYPYLISLGSTEWSIGCDVLEGNRTLTSSQIKWREIPGNRPWLAGIVTSDKCAVLHVPSLIALFEAGADIEDLNKNLKSDKPK